MQSKSLVFFILFFLSLLSFSFAQNNESSLTPTVTVTPPSQSVNPGQNATVRIVTVNVDKCTITGEPYNNFDIIKAGSILLKPDKTTEYTFKCKTNLNPQTEITTKATITIVPLPTTNGTANNVGVNTGGNTGRGGGGAQNLTAAPTNYRTDTVRIKANELCSKYSGYASVYPPASPGGGSSVPVDLTSLMPILLSIDRNTQLTANEVRAENLIKFCEEYQNMAAASERVGQNAAREIKNLADNCYTDEKCLRKRIFDVDLEQEYKYASANPYREELTPLLENIKSPKSNDYTQAEYQDQSKCNEYFDKYQFYPRECIFVAKRFEVITTKYYEAKDRVEQNQNKTAVEFARGGGMIGSRPCIETASGRSPEEVKFYEPDCINYRQEPLVVNQEALKQITALPYTQAFSPSSVLGTDGVLDNIGTRSREGNLLDGNISPTFGRTSGTGGTGGTPGTDGLKSVEESYKKLFANVGVIVQLYDVASVAYASSTSVCKNLPVATRREAVTRMEANKKTYVDYLTALKAKWDAAAAKPRENHSSLITQINFDLKDRFSQREIDRVYESVKKLLQTCVDASTPTS